MKLKILYITLYILLNTLTSMGQKNVLIIPGNILLPRDTIIKKQLISSINNFLLQTNKPNKDNTLVETSYLLETSALLDEMKNIEKKNKVDEENYYKPYLNNCIQLNDSSFLIQLTYIGVTDNTPNLRASFTLGLEKKGTQFYFHSPLKMNTLLWRTKKLGNTNIYYKEKLNISKAKAFFAMISDYDKKLNAPNKSTDFYCADNFYEVLRLIGIDYKSDYNGYVHNSLTSNENNYDLNVNGTLTSDFSKFDPHDLWHERLHKILPVSQINRPVDEGTAYLYGGSWGLSWTTILEKFKVFANENPNSDWLSMYNASTNFADKGNLPLNVDFVINALLAKKIEKEKGFAFVLQLLSCGKKEKDNVNYFNALENITGINKSNFNTAIQILIKAN